MKFPLLRLCLVVSISFGWALAAPAMADTLGKPIQKLTRIENEVGANRRYGFSRVRGHTRLGKRSQRFEIRHGDCGGDKCWDDCTNDRQCVERKEDPKDCIQHVGSQVWYSPSPSGPSVVLYLNGQKVCTYSKPLVTPAMAKMPEGDLYVKYGIYNSYVSRWLNRNKTQPVAASALEDRFRLSNGTQGASDSPAASPFKYDWGVKLPTQIAFYDEMRYGRSREQVDVRMIEARNGRPVD